MSHEKSILELHDGCTPGRRDHLGAHPKEGTISSHDANAKWLKKRWDCGQVYYDYEVYIMAMSSNKTK